MSINNPHSFRIAIVGPDPSLMGGTAAFIRKYLSLLSIEKINYQLFSGGASSESRIIPKRLYRLWLFVKLGYQVARSSNNIIHCHSGNFLNLVGYGIIILMCRLNNKRVILTLHGGDMHYKYLKFPFYRWVIKIILSNVSAASTVNQELERDLKEIGFKNVVFIPNSFSFAPEKERMAAPIPSEVENFINSHSPILVSVGAMERIHGIDIIVKAMSEIIGVYPKAGVIIIAYKTIDYSYRNEISQLIGDLGVKDNFCVPTSLPDVFPVLRKAKVFIRATRTDGDAISIREALSLGIPVIASNTGFRPKEVHLFPVGDPHGLANEVRALFSTSNAENFSSYDDRPTLRKYIELYYSINN